MGRTDTKTDPGVRFLSGYSDQRIDYGGIDERLFRFHQRIHMERGGSPGQGGSGERFYRAALSMVDYEVEERCQVVGFNRLFPAYVDMSLTQMRSYFRLRTLMRRHEVPPTSMMSYLYVYTFELLNNVGVENPGKGYRELVWLRENCADSDMRYLEQLSGWLKDYCIYYDLHGSEAEDAFGRRESGADLGVLIRLFEGDNPKDDEVFEAVRRLSSYSFDRSPCYRLFPGRLARVTARACLMLDTYMKEHYMSGLIENCFGRRGVFPFMPFRSALVYDHLERESYTYEVDSTCRYVRSDMGWVREAYFRGSKPSQELGVICHEIDRRLRRKTGVGGKLAQRIRNVNVAAIIGESIDYVLELEREESRPRIEIDMDKLSGIRTSANEIQEALIVDDPDTAGGSSPEGIGSETSGGGNTEPAENEALRTEADEDASSPEDGQRGSVTGNADADMLLKCLLTGEDWRGFVEERKLSLSMLADRINESMYDRFGDTVLEFSGDEPVLVEDYIEDIREDYE